MFDDTAGEEFIHLRAERDFNQTVTRDHNVGIARDETVGVGRNAELVVGGDHVRTVSGNEVVTIEKNLILHVVGSHSIRVEGQSRSSESAGRSNTDAVKRPGDAASGIPTIVASELMASLAVIDIAASRNAAALTWRVSQLPSGLLPIGERIERAIARRTADLGEIAEAAAALATRAARLRWRAQDPRGVLANRPAAAIALSDGDALRVQFVSSRALLSHATYDRTTATDEALETVHRAAAYRVEELGAEADRIHAALDAEDAEIRRAFDLAPHPTRVLGSGSVSGQGAGGGGGGVSQRGGASGPYGPRNPAGAGAGLPGNTATDDAPITFQGPPDPKTGEREPSQETKSSTIDIDGSGEIFASKGFKIDAGGCAIEMYEGVMTLTAATLILSAPTIQVGEGEVIVAANTVKIAGGTVLITGDPISLN